MTCVQFSSVNKCRTCLRESTEISTIESLHLSVQMMSLLNYFNIKIIEGLPNSVCTHCVTKFEDILIFRQQCAESLTILQNLYNEYIKSANDIEKTVKGEIDIVDEDVKSEEDDSKDNILKEVVDKDSKSDEDDYKDNTLDDLSANETRSDEDNSKHKKVKRKKRLTKIKNSDSTTPGNICCSHCTFTCNDQSELINHSQNKHDTACSLCNKRFVNNRNLRRHREIHQNNRPKHFCEICKKFYDSKQSYECHVKKFHSNNRQEKTVCNICGISVYQIKNHLKSKHSDPSNKLTCKYCDKVFKSQTSLRCHSLIYHENPEGYMSLCSECGRVFRTSSEMQAHVRMKHSTERKFQCRHCDKTFKSCGHRGTHEKIVHFNDRRYKCEICLKAFSAKAILENHIRTHTGEKPFVCDLCSRPFAQKTALRTHLKLVHGLESMKSSNNTGDDKNVS